MNPVRVVGLGMSADDITPTARRAVEAAEVLAGGRRLLAFFPDHPGRRLVLAGGVEGWLDEVTRAAEAQPVAVLASGDPGFHGIAARVVRRLGPERVSIIPNITTVQHAFALLKLPWDRARIISLHGRAAHRLFSAACHHDLIAVYTDPANTPDRLASLLLERGQTGWRMMVAEDLGAPNERVGAYSLAEAACAEFSDLNLVVLERTERPQPLTLGTPDQAFVHSRGLITKAEVRSVVMGKLALEPGHTMWDLGSGCGSVGLEASRLLHRGRVIAVEKNPERVEQIKANRARFGAANLEVVAGELPDALQGLDAPDRVFIGGAGPALAATVRASAEALSESGVLVVSAVRLDSVQAARQALAVAGLVVDLIQVQVSRGTQLAGDLFLQALNPVWIIRGKKEQP